MLPDDRFCRITHIFTGAGMPTGGAVVYCVGIDAGQPVSETANVAHDAFGTIIVPLMSIDITMAETIAKEGPDATGASAVWSDPVYVGAQSTTPAPPQTAVLLSKLTASGGRRNRGRMYLPGLDDPNTNDGGAIASAYVTAMQSAADAWLSSLQGSGIPMAIEHSPPYTWDIVGGQPRRIPDPGWIVTDPTEVTALQVSGITATQRRRQRR